MTQIVGSATSTQACSRFAQLFMGDQNEDSDSLWAQVSFARPGNSPWWHAYDGEIIWIMLTGFDWKDEYF